MDILQYKRIKGAKGCTLKKYGQQFQLQMRQFDNVTGEELPPAVGTLDKKHIEQQRELCAQNLAALDELLADMNTAE